MAAMDYKHCDNGECLNRVFYDADVAYREGIEVKALCKECAKKYEFIIVKRIIKPKQKKVI